MVSRPEEKNQLSCTFQNLRYLEYCAIRKFEPTNPCELETDEYDDSSLTYYVTIMGSKGMLGGCRLIDSQACVLPIEKNLVKKIETSSFEVSRYVLDTSLKFTKEERDSIRNILDRTIIYLAILLKKERLYANMRKSLFWDINKRFKYKFTQIAQPHIHPSAGILIPAMHEIDFNEEINDINLKLVA